MGTRSKVRVGLKVKVVQQNRPCHVQRTGWCCWLAPIAQLQPMIAAAGLSIGAKAGNPPMLYAWHRITEVRLSATILTSTLCVADLSANMPSTTMATMES